MITHGRGNATALHMKGEKMDKFVSETLLPSIFERWKERNKEYPTIIVSDKVAGILSGVMKQHHVMGYYKSIVTGKECEWNGRTVYLYKRGRWHFVSFGPTEEEQKDAAMQAEARGMERDIEMAYRVANSGKLDRISARLHRYTPLYHSMCDTIEDPESDFDTIEWARKWANHYKNIIDILSVAI